MKIGSVIRTQVTDTTPPKIKWFIIVGEADGDLAIVYINTDPRIQAPTAELQGLQLPLIEKECPFLEYDSHVDCSDLREKKVKGIEKLLQQDPKRLKGILTPSKLKEVQDLIKKAKSVSPFHKKKYGLTF